MAFFISWGEFMRGGFPEGFLKKYFPTPRKSLPINKKIPFPFECKNNIFGYIFAGSKREHKFDGAESPTTGGRGDFLNGKGI